MAKSCITVVVRGHKIRHLAMQPTVTLPPSPPPPLLLSLPPYLLISRSSIRQVLSGELTAFSDSYFSLDHLGDIDTKPWVNICMTH